MRMPSPDCVQGYKHGDAGARFVLSVGRYLFGVGARRPQMTVTCSSLPHRLWLICIFSLTHFESCFFLFFLFLFFFNMSQKCFRLKWKSTSQCVEDADCYMIRISRRLLSMLTLPLNCNAADQSSMLSLTNIVDLYYKERGSPGFSQTYHQKIYVQKTCWPLLTCQN